MHCARGMPVVSYRHRDRPVYVEYDSNTRMGMKSMSSSRLPAEKSSAFDVNLTPIDESSMTRMRLSNRIHV